MRAWLVVFYNAFVDLTTDRRWADGPIPWSSRRTWALDYGLDRTATRLLHAHLEAMDMAYLKWRHDNRPKDQPGEREPLGKRKKPPVD